MAARNVLVDSSYYIGLMRMKIDPLLELTSFSGDRDPMICGVVRCEVARGLKPSGLLEAFQKYWEVMLSVPTDNKLWSEVEKLAWNLDRSGIILRLPDLIIAACALRAEAALLTFDQHFKRVPGLTVLDQLN